MIAKGWSAAFLLAGLGTALAVQAAGAQTAEAAGQQDPLALAGLLIGFLVFGGAAGVAAGLIGHGAGALLAPGLYALLGAFGAPEETRAATAIGTALAVMAPLSVWSLLKQRAAETVDEAAALKLAPFAALGAALGVGIAFFSPAWLLLAACGAGAFALGLQLAFWPGAGGREIRLDGPAPLYGIGVGLAASLSGQGGGGFGAAALGLLGAPAHRAAATAAALGAALCAVGAAGFALIGLLAPAGPAAPLSLGYVNLAAVVLAAPAFALAAPVGAALALQLKRLPIRLGFALLLAAIGVTLLRQAGLG